MAEQGGQTSFVKIYLSYITLHVVPLRVELMRQGVQLHTVCKGFYAAVRSEVQQPATAAAWLRAWRPDPALLPLLMQQAERGGQAGCSPNPAAAEQLDMGAVQHATRGLGWAGVLEAMPPAVGQAGGPSRCAGQQCMRLAARSGH